MKRCRISLLLIAIAVFATALFGGTSAGAQTAGAQAAGIRVGLSDRDGIGREVVTIDSNTRWAFRTISPAMVSSPLVRLGDVVQPLDENLAAWNRLKDSPVGLVPVSGKPMKIQRERLAKAIHNAEATPLVINWFGPTVIEVNYRSTPTSRGNATLAPTSTELSQSTSGGVQQVTYVESDRHDGEQSFVPLSAAESKRIIHWLEHAVKKQHPGIPEQYRIDIPQQQAGLARLRSIAGVTSADPMNRLEAGECGFRVVGRSINGPVESEVNIVLEPHPMVPVARRSFPAGHQIQSGDLMLKPMPEEKIDPGFILDIEDAVGLEVRGAMREDRPVLHSSLGAPILVRRGDLVEVRVVGGGLTVTTNAKSLGDGSESELIEVETIQQRKRLVARIVSVGTVEIITRAPRVRP